MTKSALGLFGFPLSEFYELFVAKDLAIKPAPWSSVVFRAPSSHPCYQGNPWLNFVVCALCAIWGLPLCSLFAHVQLSPLFPDLLCAIVFVKFPIVLLRPRRPTHAPRPLRPTRYGIQKRRAKTISQKVRNVLIHRNRNACKEM
jgi:hypothetical protein